MGNQLFVICPFSGLEYFLRTHYGEDIFFLTYSAAILQYPDYEYINELKHFLLREKINFITFVNDTSCRFISQVIHQQEKFGLASESTLAQLFIEHYYTNFKDKSILDQTYNLAKLNVGSQVQECLKSSILGKTIKEHSIEVNGLITSKIDNRITQIYKTNKLKRQHAL
jgi:hypothetical protein